MERLENLHFSGLIISSLFWKLRIRVQQKLIFAQNMFRIGVH